MTHRFVDFPAEVLLKVYEQGGLDSLVGNLPCTCRKLYAVSTDSGLWQNALKDSLDSVPISLCDLKFDVANPRKWFLEQRRIDRLVVGSIEMLVHESQYPNSQSAEIVFQTVLKLLHYGLRPVLKLTDIIGCPKSLSHYHWAFVVREHLARLTGLTRLLELSTQSSWGNAPISIPLEPVLALLYMRHHEFAGPVVKRLYDTDWKAKFDSEFDSETFVFSAKETLEWANKQVQYVEPSFMSKCDFYTMLFKSCVYAHILGQAGITVRLFSFASSTYCFVEGKPPQLPEFVDFSKHGVLRSLEDIQARLHATNTHPSKVQYGLSLHDLLATVYVWHNLPSLSNRQSVLDLVEHAALDAKTSSGRLTTTLYAKLIKSCIAHSVTSFELAGEPVSLSTSEHENVAFKPGQICSIAGELCQHCVVLEPSTDFCLVLRDSTVARVSCSVLRPGFDGKTTTFANMVLPDIPGLDFVKLGDWFLTYDPATKMFTNSM